MADDVRPVKRPVLDVSTLPTEAFGNRDLMWWGTVGFMVIEGFTLVLAAVSWLYLRQNFDAWPPEGILLPERVVPSLHVVWMLLSLPMVRQLDRAARAHDLARVRRWLTVATLFCIVSTLTRAWEITRSLNVRWDANAYGSVQWLILGAHGTLLAVQLAETFGMAAIFWRGPVETKHFSDSADVAFYWLFIVLGWIPLYVLCFLSPWWW